MNKLHVAFFTNTYHPVVNGVVRSVSAFRQALTDLGHNIFIFAQHDDEYKDDEPFVFRYPSLELPLSVDVPAVIPVSHFVDRLLPSLKLDAIHTHHPVLLGRTAANKARKLNLPLVFTFHTQYKEYSHYFPLPQKAVQKFVKEMIHDWLGDYLHRCHHVVVPSQGMLNILKKEYGLTKGYSVIPTGIDLELYQLADGDSIREQMGWGNEMVLISIGRLGKEKNWSTLLKANALAMEKHPQLKLVIIGDGPERKSCQEEATSLGIADRVEFLGKLPFQEVPAYLNAADCFCFASVTETQGLVTLEAAASGLPVVAVRATGTSDIIRNGKEGLLTENDSRALGQAIQFLCEHPETVRKFKAGAIERAKSFDIKRQAQQLMEVYAQAKEAHQRGEYVQVDAQKAGTQ